MKCSWDHRCLHEQAARPWMLSKRLHLKTKSYATFQLDKLHKLHDSECESQVIQQLDPPEPTKRDSEHSGAHIADAKEC